jgi:hypothetical protein
MKKDYLIRLVLIIGAAASLVVGVKRIAELIMYQVTLDPVELVIIALPFVPIFLMAPRSAGPKKHVLFGFAAALETIVITSNFVLVLR